MPGKLSSGKMLFEKAEIGSITVRGDVTLKDQWVVCCSHFLISLVNKKNLVLQTASREGFSGTKFVFPKTGK